MFGLLASSIETAGTEAPDEIGATPAIAGSGVAKSITSSRPA